MKAIAICRNMYIYLYSMALLLCLATTLASAQTANRPALEPVARPLVAYLTEDYMRFRQQQISNPAYHLVIDLKQRSDSFSGVVTATFDLIDGNTAPVTIDFDIGTIDSVTVNGTAANFSYERWFISIPPAAFKRGNNTVVIAYHRPYTRDGAGLHYFIDPENGEEYLYTNFEPYAANRWFPHFDQPNLKAPLTLEVTAPPSWQVIANTRESSVQIVNGRRHWQFPATAKLSSYVYAMHAGPYQMWESNAGNIPLRLFARNALARYVKPDEWFTPTQQSFEFFQDYFQVPYPFGKYDQIIVPDFNAGAMENVGAVTFNERYISRGEKSVAQLRSLASVIAHEMSHMWFGDLVTMDWWNGLWLNESFATYMANLALERASSFTNVWDSFYTGNKLGAYRADALITTHPIEQKVASTADAFTNFDSITYGKGGSVLKQLPYFIGEENFRNGIRSYLKKYAYQNTTLDNFVDELALASGLNLDQWQQEWLYQSGLNTVQADFSCDNGVITSLKLIQHVPTVSSADKVLRSQRTQVGLYRYTDRDMFMGGALPVTYSGPITWVMDAVGRPCPDLVLPNEGDWAVMKINLDPVSRATLNEHINDFNSPTTRIMLWQSLWDSVEDGSLTLPGYLDFVLNNIAEEQDDNVLRHVLGTLGSTFSYFSRFGGFAAEKARIEDFLLTQLQAAAAGSELQKIWYDSFVARAHTPAALDYLAALLDGRITLPGLSIDQDKRWGILVALNRYQHGNYIGLLENERENDPSDQGNNMAFAADAVRPAADIKARWLDALLNHRGEYKLATLRNVMAYLFPDEQLALLAPHVEQILGAIPALDRNSDIEFLGDFTDYMSAALCTPASTARLARANTEFSGFQPAVVKAYLVHQQQDARCVQLKALLQ